MDATARTFFGFAAIVFGALLHVAIKNGGPSGAFYDDLTNVRGIVLIRRMRIFATILIVAGVLSLLSAVASALIHGRLFGAP